MLNCNMRKKASRHRFLGCLVLLGMLFHVLVSHQDGAAELLLSRHHDGRVVLENIFPHVESAHYHEDANHPDEDTSAPTEHSHQHLAMDHPEAYTCPSSTQAQDLLSLRLASLLASLPLRLEIPQTQLKLASLWEIPEPQPPPEQRRRALATTILLI